MAETKDLTLDGSDVARADIAFVQLVVSAARTANRHGKHLRLTNMPQAVDAAFLRAGVSPRDPDCPVS